MMPIASLDCNSKSTSTKQHPKAQTQTLYLKCSLYPLESTEGVGSRRPMSILYDWSSKMRAAHKITERLCLCPFCVAYYILMFGSYYCRFLLTMPVNQNI